MEIISELCKSNPEDIQEIVVWSFGIMSSTVIYQFSLLRKQNKALQDFDTEKIVRAIAREERTKGKK